MEGMIIVHVFHVSGTQIIEARVYEFSRGGNLEEITRGVYELKFIPLYLG